ncbi:MAG: histidine phosphatase family protein [Psychrobium sp.]|nr:histidine phosphatase family protein [Psychrobium sp.]
MEIILIRHGKPTSATNPRLSAGEYAKWIHCYNHSNIAVDSRPHQEPIDCSKYFIVSSDLKRAQHSASIYTGQAPSLIDKYYREMEIPRYKIPLRLRAWTWVYLCRVLWMLGVKGPFESFAVAKQRAEQAADKLIALTCKKDKVMLFSHGYLNFYIRKALVKKGWRLNDKSSEYWGVTKLYK